MVVAASCSEVAASEGTLFLNKVMDCFRISLDPKQSGVCYKASE